MSAVTTEHPPARVYAIVLNWNGWQDTIRCLQSLMALDHPALRIVVCDNGSVDDSLARIKQWARDGLPGQAFSRQAGTANTVLEGEVAALTELERQQAVQGGSPEDTRFVLIRNGVNLGYAGGNNVGLRYAMARDDFDYVWLLNNDTVVHPDALRALITHMRARPDAGLCGATLIDFDIPDRIQARGGARFNPWLGTHRALGAGERSDRRAPPQLEKELDYIIGASVFVSRRWLYEIGLLCEAYFLYFEEIDWAMRGRGRLALTYAPNAIVYHKRGATIGRPARNREADLLALRNRLRFTWRICPWALPTVWLGMFGVLGNRFRRGQWDRILPIVGLMLGSAWWKQQP